MFVVVTDVDPEDAFEVPSVHDQDPVEAFATDCADPPFDERVRARCAYGCADRPDAVGAEHLIEGRRELAVTVVDQEPDGRRSLLLAIRTEASFAGGIEVRVLTPEIGALDFWVFPRFRSHGFATRAVSVARDALRMHCGVNFNFMVWSDFNLVWPFLRWRLYGAPTMEGRVPTFAIRHESLTPRDAAERLGERGFAVWDGNYYAIEIMQRLGLDDGAVRIGIVHYNTTDEVARLLDALGKIAR